MSGVHITCLVMDLAVRLFDFPICVSLSACVYVCLFYLNSATIYGEIKMYILSCRAVNSVIFGIALSVLLRPEHAKKTVALIRFDLVQALYRVAAHF